MCMMSVVMDDFNKRHLQWTQTPLLPPIPPITRQEFDDLRKEVAELKELLLAAKKYDEATGQPDCETAEKAELLKRLAELVGADLSSLFSAPKAA